MLLLSGVASGWAYDDPMTHYTDPYEEAFNGAKFSAEYCDQTKAFLFG